MVSLSHNITREDKKQEKLRGQLVELQFVQIADWLVDSRLIIMHQLELWILLHYYY